MNKHIEAKIILTNLEDDATIISPEINDWWAKYLHNHYHRYLDALSFLDRNDKEKEILEVGSVPGHFTVLLKELGYNVRGIDINPTRVKQIWDKYSISVDQVDIEKESLPFPSESFDLIFFTEILEHLRLNPLHALREVYRVLKPTGRIILSTPNITPLHRLAFLFGRDYQGDVVEEFKKLEWLGHMGHIRLYSFEEVKKLLEFTGFKIFSYTYKGKVVGRKKLRLIKSVFRAYLYIIAKK